MTTRAKTTPGTTAGSFAPEHRAEADVELAVTPAYDVITTFVPGSDLTRPGGFVSPKTCGKCGGDGGYTYASGADGICSRCNRGQVEGSRPALAANKARRDTIEALHKSARAHSDDAHAALQHLREHEPERWEKALASHGAGHPALMTSLDSYWEEQTRAAREERRRLFPPQEIAMEWQSFDDLHEPAKEAIRHQSGAAAADNEAYARTRQWQWARVPTEIMTERIMAADPELVEDHGTFEAYHSWYVAQGDVVDHGDSYWPSIEASPGMTGYLDDGWHRFHSYVAKGMKNVPVLRSRPMPVEG